MPDPIVMLNQPRLTAFNLIKQPTLALLDLTGPAMLAAINPALAQAVSRDQLTVPIARRTPTDTDSFTAPDGSRRFYMPQYQIAEVSGPNGARYDMAFQKDHTDRWCLRLRLNTKPPVNAGTGLAPLEHDLSLTLSFQPGGDTGRNRKHLGFGDLVRVAGGVEARLWCDSLPERDEVYHAMTNPAYASRLTLCRPTRLALAQTSATTESFEIETLENNLFLKTTDLNKVLAGRNLRQHIKLPQNTGLPAPRLALASRDRIHKGAKTMTRFRVSVVNWKDFSPTLFETITWPANATPPAKAARLDVQLVEAKTGKPLRSFATLSKPQDLQNLDLILDQRRGMPDQVFVMIVDRKTGRGQKSDPIALAAPQQTEQTYTVHRFDFETTLTPDPFVLDPGMHAYVFAALAGPPPAPSSGGLIRHRETYRSLVHSYFQDDIAQNRIYFLPDEFRLARHTGPYRPPMVTVRVQSQGADTIDSEVTLDYVMAPYVDPERIAQAAQQIAASTGRNAADLTFQPYLTDRISFTVTRPSTAGRVIETRPTSPLMLQEPVVDTLVMNVTDFQIAFDAMLGQTASIVGGEIGISVEGWAVETRRFAADFAQLLGATLDLSTTPTGDHSATLDFTQAIESPLAFHGTRVAVSRDGATVAASGLETIHADLAPGATISAAISYPALPGTGPVQVALLGSGPVRPDGEAIMDAILDRAALDYFRLIEVRSVPSFFRAPTGAPQEDAIVAIMVAFEGGDTVTLTADAPIGTARIDYPFSKVILRQMVDDGSYQYTKTIIRADGRQTRDAVPTRGTGMAFFVTTSVSVG